MRKVGLTRQQREVVKALKGGPVKEAGLTHLSNTVFNLKLRGVIEEVGGRLYLTDAGREALETGYLQE